jgi:hypothetical protein
MSILPTADLLLFIPHRVRRVYHFTNDSAGKLRFVFRVVNFRKKSGAFRPRIEALLGGGVERQLG